MAVLAASPVMEGAASRVIYELSGGPFLSGLRSQQPPSRWWLGAGAQGRFASSLAPMSRSALTDRMLCFRQTARLRPGDASAKLSGGGRLGFFLGLPLGCQAARRLGAGQGTRARSRQTTTAPRGPSFEPRVTARRGALGHT